MRTNANVFILGARRAGASRPRPAAASAGRRATLGLAIAAALAAAALAPTQGSGASPAGALSSTAPAPPGPEEMKLLKALEAAGERYTTIRAAIDYHVDLRALGDSEDRTGWVAYRKGDANTPAKFRITFDTLRQGAGAKIRSQVDYAFDGEWLAVAKHSIKNLTLYQVAAKGQRVEPLRIGKGPFPVPFGQRADDIITYFEVKRLPAQGDDPKDADALRLDTRPQHAEEMPVSRIEMWIDRKTHLPVKLRSRDKSNNVTTVTFQEVRTNAQVAGDVFRIAAPLGWETVRRPLAGAHGLAP